MALSSTLWANSPYLVQKTSLHNWAGFSASFPFIDFGGYTFYPYASSLSMWTVFLWKHFSLKLGESPVSLIHPTGEVQIHFVKVVSTLCFS